MQIAAKMKRPLQIRKLKEQLAEANNACEVANSILDKVAEINKEMLNDLKQTEDEAAEDLNELNALTMQFDRARAEIDDAKYVTTFATAGTFEIRMPHLL